MTTIHMRPYSESEKRTIITQCAQGEITIHKMITLLECTDAEAADLVNTEIRRIIADKAKPEIE